MITMFRYSTIAILLSLAVRVGPFPNPARETWNRLAESFGIRP